MNKKYREFVLVSLDDAAKLAKGSKTKDKYFQNTGQFNTAELQQLNKLQTGIDLNNKNPRSGKTNAKKINDIFFITRSKTPAGAPLATQPKVKRSVEIGTGPTAEETFKSSDSYVNKSLKRYARSYKSQYDKSAAIIDFMQENPDRFTIDLNRGTWSVDGRKQNDDIVDVLLQLTRSNSKTSRKNNNISHLKDFPQAVRSLKEGGLPAFMVWNQDSKNMYTQQPRPRVRVAAGASPALIDWEKPFVRQPRLMEFTPAKKRRLESSTVN